MDKKNYLIITAAFIFLTDSSYRADNRAMANNKINALPCAVDKSVGQCTGKVFITNVTCGSNLSN
jgi:hypothetical protein